MFKIVPDPTFADEVKVTIPGAEQPGVLAIVWRHKGRAALKAWLDAIVSTDNGDALHEVISKWSGVVDEQGAPVPYSRNALGDLLDHYPASGGELLKRYLEALTESRLGN